MKKRSIICAFIFAVITVFIFKNSAKSALESSEQSGFFVDFVINNISFIFKSTDMATTIIRKLAHFTEFFIQGAALCGCIFSEKFNKNFIYVLFTGLLTACIDEYIQLFFEGRGSQVSDIFIDFSGTLLSVLVFMLLWYFIKKAGK